MTGASSAHRRIPSAPERRLVVDSLRLGHRKAMMHGFLELDVTLPRRLLHDQRQHTGESLSFTAFILACLGRAVAEHPEVHALRGWFGRCVLFEDVDVTTIVETEVGGRPFPMAHIVRATNRRTVREIHDEIRATQAAGVRSASPGTRFVLRLLLLVPGILRRLFVRFLLRFPQVAKRRTGTVLLTAVGMFGRGAGWGLGPPGIHGLSIVVGGIFSRPAAAVGDHVGREFLCLTVSADHALIDGAPLARFVHDLGLLIEAGDGLLEQQASDVGW